MIKIDMHVHTYHSGHSLLKPKDIVKAVSRRGIDGICLLDHNILVKNMDFKDLIVIKGEEIKTDKGEIAGLFLNETVSPGNLYDVIDSIRAQDGLIYVPHPFDRLRKSAVNDENIAKSADIIEVFNSRVVIHEDNLKASIFAEKYGICRGAGSDAHAVCEVGNAYVEMEEFTDKTSFFKNLKNSSLHGRLSSPLIHAYTKGLKAVRRII